MKLIIDCMGGDKGVAEVLGGVVAAKAEFGGEYLLVGNQTEIAAVAAERGYDLGAFEILHTDVSIVMEDEPMTVMKEKKNSSMSLGLRALADGQGDAFVSCGNTGALFCGASLTVRRIKGVHRAAIAAVLPFTPPVLLLDAGANVTVQPEFLVQFAAMGSAYMKALYGLENPRVGLLNNGAESHKGTPLQTEAYKLLSDAEGIRFVGNVEGGNLPNNACDVVVTDGFTGNVTLKTIEGLGKLFMKRMKGIFYANFMTKLAGSIVRKPLGQFKKDFDVSEHGGSPILGLRKPVIKAHGSSDARAIRSAIRQAIRYAEGNIIASVEATLAAPKAPEKTPNRKEE